MRAVRLTLLTVALAFLGAGALAAQNSGTVIGQVTDGSTGEPLAGVQMQVAGTNIGGLTDQNGRYVLTRVPAGNQTIRAILIGYSQTTQAVTVEAGGTATADFELQTSAVRVEGLVVTATGERRRQREVGASVGKVDVSEIPLAVNSNVSSVLQSRTPGVTVVQSSGTTGTGSRIRIRGSASVSLNNDPLIIVDGVRASNSTGNSIGVGGQDVSRLDDFSPEDIESIEVLKGPAASALYGTAAANGVIVITTKKGTAGATRWNAYVETGSLTENNDFPANYSGFCTFYPDGAEQIPANALFSFGGCDTGYALSFDAGSTYDVSQDSIHFYNPLEGDHANNPFETGVRQKYGLSASGGSETVTYFLSGDFENEDGIYKEVSNLESVSLRANLSAQLTDNLDASVQTGWVNSDLRLPQNDNNILGILPSAYLGGADSASAYGFFTLDELQAIDTRQEVERFTSSAQANYRPLSWLSFNGTAGMDMVSRFDNETIPPQRVFYASLPEGERTSNRIEITTYTANLNAAAEYEISPTIYSSTDVGIQYTEDQFQGTYAYGRGLLAGCSSLNCVATGFNVDEATTVTKLFGTYISQQFSFNDRLFITGTLRADDSSTFGQDLDLTVYPSTNISWVIGEEEWFPELDALSLLRLRAGWGQAGLQPGFRDAVRFLSPAATTLQGQVVPAFTFGGIGNPDLKPEISTELEVGADIGLLNDRLGLELTYYNKSSTDALVSRDLAPSIGVATSQLINIGEVTNKGFEALATLRLANTENVQWNASVSYSMNDNELVELGTDPATGTELEPIIFGLGGNTQRHQEGFPLGAYFQPRYTYEDANGDGILEIGEVTVEDTASYLGSPFPGREMSFQTNVTLFNVVRLSGLLDHKGDYMLYNGTSDFRCGTYYNCRAGYAGYEGVDVSLEDQAAYIAVAYGAGNSVAGYIEDASFWKLRELAATIMFPNEWANYFGADGMNLTLAGRNLVTWTDYSGPDPEINGAGTGSNFNTFDFFSQPPVRTLTARLDLSF